MVIIIIALYIFIPILCRNISNVRGLTRELLIALTTNIESREQKCCSNVSQGLTQEHPRASTTDDTECFFNVIRDVVGKHFTYKDVQFAWRKGCIEFGKRLNPELPFIITYQVMTVFMKGCV